jgi:hypothetical protein|mmetsp:Transcript_87403/g.138002  ORF Transcript_87403/g.138002 Transcript_87403/m.138002 type:complete len:369 (+) Transcript_87403:114-1220(+)
MGYLQVGSSVISHVLFGQQYFNQFHNAQAREISEWFWAIGVVVTLLGSSLTVVGFMVQKRSHAAETKDSSRPYCLQREWLMGTGIWILGNFVCWVALGLAPQAILASLNCWNIGVTLVIAPLLLGEPVSGWTATSSVLLAFGTGWVIAFGPKQYQQQTVTSIVSALSRSNSICAFLGTAIFLASMFALGVVRSRSRSSSGLSYLQYTMVSATFAWYATLLSKSAAKIFVTSVQLSRPMYEQPAFWLFVAGFAICGIAQMHFLNMGLKIGDAVMVIPLYEAISMTGQLVIGGLVFDEFAHFGFQEHAWFWSGVFVVVIGIASLVFEVQSAAKTGAGVDEKTPLKTRLKAAAKEDSELPFESAAATMLYK